MTGRSFYFQAFQNGLVQVNHYHSIPRYSFFPELSKSMLTNEYGPAVDATGYLPEYANRNPLSRRRLRDMSASEPGLIIEVYNTFSATADEAFLTEMYGAVGRCARWLIQRAKPFGIPQAMQSTYDSWKLDTHDVTAYSECSSGRLGLRLLPTLTVARCCEQPPTCTSPP